jgi:predicted dinucleotide-binding enzyme
MERSWSTPWCRSFPPKVSVVQLPAAGSPAAVAQRVLGPQVRVAAAFHNVGAKKLHGGEKVDCDVLVFADDVNVREQVIALAGIVATRGVDGGSLANSVAAEALTSVLIAINRRYKVPGPVFALRACLHPTTR